MQKIACRPCTLQHESNSIWDALVKLHYTAHHVQALTDLVDNQLMRACSAEHPAFTAATIADKVFLWTVSQKMSVVI